jgi:lipoate-protein ligase A
MRWMDMSLAEPAGNLALDEALLEQVNRGAAPDCLRFWESATPFVVLGTTQVLAHEVQEHHCTADGVAITRRCSAGGAVLQGPGSLNYTLVLTYERVPEVRNLRGSYAFIVGGIAAQLRALGLDATHEGISDLAIAGRKVSGTAQRRKRHAMLHHGTLLYRASYAGMARYLAEPADRPGYRGGRTHAEFVGEIPMDGAALKTLVRKAWSIEGPSVPPEPEELRLAEQLAREKYTQPAWTRRR